MARKRSHGSELEQILQDVDPAQLKNIAFDLGADFYVFSDSRPAPGLVRYFQDRGRVRNLAIHALSALKQAQSAQNRLGQLLDQLPASGPDYRLWIIQVKPDQATVRVSEFKSLFARWFQIGSDDVTFMGAVQESGQLSILAGILQGANVRDIGRIREAAEQDDDPCTPVSIAGFDTQDAKTRDRWRALVTQARKRQDSEEYRPYSRSEFNGSASNKAQFIAVLLIVLVLAGFLIYPSCVAWLGAARTRAQTAWTDFTVQTSIGLKSVGNVLGSLIRQAFATGVVLVFLIGLTVAIFPLEKLLFRDRHFPSIRESVVGLYASYGWVILTVANAFACVFSLLIASALANRSPTGWEWGIQAILAFGVEAFGILRFLKRVKSLADSGE